MISRYQRAPMAAVWSEQNRFDTYLKIEILNAEALAARNVIGERELELIRKNASFTLDRVREWESITQHDVIAFTRAVGESLGEERRFIHYGLTSTDVVDTANGVLLKQADALILADLERFMDVLKKQAYTHRDTFCIGRTHGMHAEVTVFGLKWALWHEDMKRAKRRFLAAAAEVECGKISGAVGNYAFTDPAIETFVCGKLGIAAAKISTQTLQRDRHASYLSAIALVGAELEKIATEIRHLQRTEVGEVAEPFAKTQKGSSAMPHKHNPISSENICGLARVMRGYVIPAMEDVALWHERDISHSSVERILLPDATSLLDYMLDRYAGVLAGLVVHPERMAANLGLTHGTIFSQRVLTALIDAGSAREEAYDLIQAIAAEAYRTASEFQALLLQNNVIASTLGPERIAACFTLDYYTRHVDHIYEVVFGDPAR
ncbi:MAG TPA: adenylosuccinate lyase [Acholeplasmatales bacterium]|nr:adenylosuccinate lyase [Acholeplasmatales bacterium]